MLDGVIIELLGTEAPTDADWNAKVGGLLASNDTLDTENTGLKEQVVELEASIVSLEELRQKAELGEKYLADTRTAALTSYRLAKGDDASDAMVKTIEAADLSTALALQVEFSTEVEKTFPLKCDGCGSVKVSRRTSKEETGQPGATPSGEADAYKMG